MMMLRVPFGYFYSVIEDKSKDGDGKVLNFDDMVINFDDWIII